MQTQQFTNLNFPNQTPRVQNYVKQQNVSQNISTLTQSNTYFENQKSSINNFEKDDLEIQPTLRLHDQEIFLPSNAFLEAKSYDLNTEIYTVKIQKTHAQSFHSLISARSRPLSCTDHMLKQALIQNLNEDYYKKESEDLVDDDAENDSLNFRNRFKKVSMCQGPKIRDGVSSNRQGTLSNYQITACTEQCLEQKKGWLQKRSESALFKQFNKKYFILEDRKLKYYHDEKMLKLEGCIDFDLISFEVIVSKKSSPRVFKLVLLQKETSKSLTTKHLQRNRFTFMASTTKELHEWVDLIIKHQRQSQGFKGEIVQKIAFEKKFWKTNRLNVQKFMQTVDTGDILLFQSKAMASKVQRMLTRSDYDHIALLIKYDNSKIVIFESLRDQGVQVCQWDKFINMNWHDMYHKIVYRKLFFPRTKMFHEGLEDFMKQSIGKRFKINAAKLLRQKCDSDNSQIIKDDKGYFCSELVASAYKRLGILDQERAASKYWPGDFSQENANSQSQFRNGAYLGEQYTIDFIN
eukprot:403371331